MQIKGSIALVTGANRGIGAELAKALLASGAAKVYGAARDPAAITGAGLVPVRLDVTQDDQVAAAAATCRDVTLLINNAGIAAFTPLLEAPTLENAEAEMATNYFGTLRMCRAFAPVLKANGGGAIVNVLSVAAMFNVPMQGSYCASKAAETSLTHGIRHELKAQGTAVHGAYFGYVDTGMTAHLSMPKESPADIARGVLAGIAAGEEEILVDQRARDTRAALMQNPRAMELAMQAAWDARQRR
ncbi:SDR family oxidoreductase [Desertibaculum subflavum]|uniref:SDR family oxidoreductase n=1 Tax=Desertibaculum subflavum TaxID=2268458 RepID=UPI000E670D98